MSDQTHLIFGTGLIGGYLGGVFLSQGMDATFLGRPKSHAAMADGLTVADLDGHTATVPAPTFYADQGQGQEQGQFDVIWVAVKCLSTASIIDQLRLLLKAESTIVCCQNGFGSDQIIRDSFPDHQVISGIVVFNVAQVTDNHLYKSTQGEFIVERAPATEACLDKFDSELLPSRLSSQLTAEKWAKLQLNLGNAVNALADVPVLEMLQTRGYRRVMAALMEELIAVTSAMNLELPKMSAVPAKWLPKTMNTPDWLYQRLANKVLTIDPTARTSMWWDLSAGKKTEIDYLNAAVVSAGKQFNIACPVNQKLVALVKSVENGERNIGIPADQMQTELL